MARSKKLEEENVQFSSAELKAASLQTKFYTDLKYLLSSADDLKILKTEIRNIKAIHEIVKNRHSHIHTKSKKIVDSLILGSMTLIIQDLNDALFSFQKILKQSPDRLESFSKFSKLLNADKKLKKVYSRTIEEVRPSSAALSEHLYELSEILGTSSRVDKFLKTVPGSRPTDLPVSHNKNLIRKRIARHKIKFDLPKASMKKRTIAQRKKRIVRNVRS